MFYYQHFFYCRTKRIGLTLKILLLVSLPVPLVVWPILGIAGSLLVGIGHGFFTPLIETFEASGATLSDKFFHYFVVSVPSLSKIMHTWTLLFGT